jgi:hypothetical protein
VPSRRSAPVGLRRVVVASVLKDARFRGAHQARRFLFRRRTKYEPRRMERSPRRETRHNVALHKVTHHLSSPPGTSSATRSSTDSIGSCHLLGSLRAAHQKSPRRGAAATHFIFTSSLFSSSPCLFSKA